MNIYYKYLILLVEAIVLCAVFIGKGPNAIFFAFIIPIVYFIIGLVHGQIFDNKIKACAFLLVVGSMAGVIMTFAGYKVSTLAVEPIMKEWFVNVLVNNVIAYTVNVLGILEFLVGVFVSSKVLAALLPGAKNSAVQ